MNADAYDNRDRQHRVHEGLPEFRLVLRIVEVEMKPRRVHRHRRERNIIGFRECPADGMLNHESRFELFEPFSCVWPCHEVFP